VAFSVTKDCDKLAHNLYLKGNPLRDSLVHEFGSDILLRDGNINRPMLARKVCLLCSSLVDPR
jgi:dephospho-CoA kinase